jgi:hypothetical protein
MSRQCTILLLIGGAVFVALSQTEHSMFDGFRGGFAALGYSLAALAHTRDVGSRRRGDRRYPTSDKSEDVTPSKPTGPIGNPFVLFALVALIIGCAHRHDPARPPTNAESEAVTIVWHVVYEQERPPPAIRWVEGDELDCANGERFTFAGMPDGGCFAGLTWRQGHRVLVARPKHRPIHQTALAHELWHMAMPYDDPEHTSEGFQGGGAVSRATEALQAAGL